MSKGIPFLLKAVGADPEFFLKNGYGGVVPAIGKIGGTKQKPIFVDDDGFTAMQEDNVMVEFNIIPARTADEFVRNINKGLTACIEKAKESHLLPCILPSAVFFARELMHPQAMEIGCLGDVNAWTNLPNEPLDAKALGAVRCAGGHLHISYEFRSHLPKALDRSHVVRWLDIALGLPSAFIDRDDVRRKFYGKAGAFRSRDYGVEYRTLSNFWLLTQDLQRWVFGQVQWAFKQMNDGLAIPQGDDELIQRAINTPDRGLVQELLAKYGVRVPQMK